MQSLVQYLKFPEKNIIIKIIQVKLEKFLTVYDIYYLLQDGNISNGYSYILITARHCSNSERELMFKLDS